MFSWWTFQWQRIDLGIDSDFSPNPQTTTEWPGECKAQPSELENDEPDTGINLKAGS